MPAKRIALAIHVGAGSYPKNLERAKKIREKLKRICEEGYQFLRDIFLNVPQSHTFHFFAEMDNVREVARQLVAKGNKLLKDITQSPRGGTIANIDPASSHGVWFQLVDD